MDPVVVIPVKSFTGGKLRLAEQVGPRARAELGRALAGRVAETVDATGLIAMFVTADPEVAAWAAGGGFPSVPESGEGLNAAARAGAEWAYQARSPWIVLHADLPLLLRADVERLAEVVGGGSDVIAPSSDGGTSAIGSTVPIDFAFGPGSFTRHLARLSVPEIVASVGLLHDVDTPADLESASRHRRGSWLATYIG